VDELLKLFNGICKEQYVPSKYLSVNECLSGFRGKTVHLQYIPSKPDEYGLKFFVLADFNGFVIDAWLYRGSMS